MFKRETRQFVKAIAGESARIPFRLLKIKREKRRTRGKFITPQGTVAVERDDRFISWPRAA